MAFDCGREFAGLGPESEFYIAGLTTTECDDERLRAFMQLSGDKSMDNFDKMQSGVAMARLLKYEIALRDLHLLLNGFRQADGRIHELVDGKHDELRNHLNLN